MAALFPSIEPYKKHNIPVDQDHTLYVEESGNPNGIPVVFLHGGPGAASNENFRRIFDPKLYHIILFDQRGAGKSTPLGELKNNTTQHLVSDLEIIRQSVKIDKWVIFGESWGTALGLVYAETHPERVSYLILRGVLLARQQDIDWFYKPGGVNLIFPEAFEAFIKDLNDNEKKDVLLSYYQRFTNYDKKIQIEAAKSFIFYGKQCNTLLPMHLTKESIEIDVAALSGSRIEAYYYSKKFFLEQNFILKNIKKIEKIPSIIIHGRYDMCCVFNNAYLLNKALPQSKLQIISDAGHSVLESGYQNILSDVTNKVGKDLSPL